MNLMENTTTDSKLLIMESEVLSSRIELSASENQSIAMKKELNSQTQYDFTVRTEDSITTGTINEQTREQFEKSYNNPENFTGTVEKHQQLKLLQKDEKSLEEQKVEYDQNRNLTLDNLFEDLDNLLIQEPQQIEKINSIIKHLEHEVHTFSDTQYLLFGYFSYQIAETCLSRHSNLTQEQRYKYTRLKKNFQTDYDDYIAQKAQIIVNKLTNEELQDIDSQFRRSEREKHEGTMLLSQIIQFVSNLYKLIKQSKVTNAVSHARSIVGITKKVSVFETSLRQCVSRSNLLFLSGSAALETCNILFKQHKDSQYFSKQTDKNQLEKRVNQEFKALSMRVLSSFVINSVFSIAGTTIGSLFIRVGKTKGGIAGAILGQIISFLVEKKMIDPYFLKRKDYLKSAYKQMEIETFEKNNKRPFTREGFYRKVHLCLIKEHPDKFQSESLKENARDKIIQIQFAKQLIEHEMGWDK